MLQTILLPGDLGAAVVFPKFEYPECPSLERAAQLIHKERGGSIQVHEVFESPSGESWLCAISSGDGQPDIFIQDEPEPEVPAKSIVIQPVCEDPTGWDWSNDNANDPDDPNPIDRYSGRITPACQKFPEGVK